MRVYRGKAPNAKKPLNNQKICAAIGTAYNTQIFKEERVTSGREMVVNSERIIFGNSCVPPPPTTNG